jgi:fermentation-respiration switch protein FrsA (DUF1100 family)
MSNRANALPCGKSAKIVNPKVHSNQEKSMRTRSLLALLTLFAWMCPTARAQDAPPAPDWKTLEAAYSYDAKTQLKVTEEPKQDSEFLSLHLSFANALGQTVPGIFLRPKKEGVYPCVLLLHGLTSNKETMILLFGRQLAQRGIACLALDADQHGERKPKDRQPTVGGMGFVHVVRSGIMDYRLALDYLKTRKDVDSKRIGLLGYSMGAMMGAILSGVDTRIAATALCVGGDMTRAFLSRVPANLRDQMASTSPSLYVGHISPRPVLFLNGKKDNVVPEAAAKALHEAAREPKEIIWSDDGHILAPTSARKSVEWLEKKLGK